MPINVIHSDSPTSDGQQPPFSKEDSNYGLVYSQSAGHGFPTSLRSSSPPPFLLDTISFTSDTLVERVIEPDGPGTTPIPVDPISTLSMPDLLEAQGVDSPREDLFKQDQFFIPPLTLNEPLPSNVQTNSSESIFFGLQQSPSKERISTSAAHDGDLASLPGASYQKAQSMEPILGSSNECMPSDFVAFKSVDSSMERLLGNRKTESSKQRNTTHIMTNSGSVSNKKKRSKGVGTMQGLLTVSSQSATTLKEQRARRNRESAKRSRIKNKLYFEKLEATHFEVCNENKSLKQIIEQLLPGLLDVSPGLRTQLEALFDANPSIKLS